MKPLFLIGILLVGLLASNSVWTSTECDVPVADWQPRETLRKQIEQQGWQVHLIKVDDGCYEVRGIDAKGNRFKAKYAPDSLNILKMEIKDGRHGESRHGHAENPK